MRGMNMEIVNGWYIYPLCNMWVADNKCGSQYYYASHDEAVFAAKFLG